MSQRPYSVACIRKASGAESATVAGLDVRFRLHVGRAKEPTKRDGRRPMHVCRGGDLTEVMHIRSVKGVGARVLLRHRDPAYVWGALGVRRR